MSPLTKRFPRELKANLGKYLGIFLLMTIAISFTSGFLVAASSIERTLDGMRDTYLVEDGRFATAFEAPDDAIDAVEDLDVTVHEAFSYDLDFKAQDGVQNATARVYEQRTAVNLAAYAEGHAPEADDEIALDRVFCQNNDIEIGDTVQAGGVTFTVCGIMTLPDYQALFEDNASFVFNALTFTVAEVSPDAFEALGRETGTAPTYTYSFIMDDRTMPADERADVEERMVEALGEGGATVTDLLDADSNQGIGYAVGDVEGDQGMWQTLSLVLIAIMAFTFVVLTAGTIEDESAIIGTLLASGYRKRELVAHYLLLPCLVGVAAAAVGNVLGYTLMADPMKGLYYNSYSLPPYEAFWSWKTFFLTTAVPLALLVGITLAGLVRTMRHTPLQFLRHELGRGGTKRGIRLPDRFPFTARFRIRVFVRNLGNFATLFLGIAFASLLLLFGLCMMPTMDHYASQLRGGVPAEHLYTLKAPLELEGTDDEREAWAAAALLTSVDDPSDLGLSQAELLETVQAAQTVDPDAHPVNTTAHSEGTVAQAEKFAAASLTYARGGDAGEEPVTVYGIAGDSRYWSDVDVSGDGAALGRGMAQKFGIDVGDSVTLHSAFEGTDYTFTVDALYGEPTNMSLYLSIDAFNRAFGNDADFFNGYASDETLQLDARYLAGETTPADMDKAADQMNDSMDNMTSMMTGLAVAVFLVFMYLLTKTVIDRSARAISYMKVFGYRDREINTLYLRSITLTVCVSLVACLPLLIMGLSALFRIMLYDITGNIEVYTPIDCLAIDVAVGLATYAVVAFLHTRRIKRVPLALALKVQE